MNEKVGIKISNMQSLIILIYERLINSWKNTDIISIKSNILIKSKKHKFLGIKNEGSFAVLGIIFREAINFNILRILKAAKETKRLHVHFLFSHHLTDKQRPTNNVE